MNQLEPIYLRYIYNGLQKGSLSLYNTANLPDGFVGLYEEVFATATNTKRENIKL